MNPRAFALAAGTVLVLALGAGPTAAQKYGGTLKALLPGNPPSLSMLEVTAYYTVFPMAPVYNNLAVFDQLKARESLDTIVPELAESWSWSPDAKALTFRLRRGVTFHDGAPFSSRDVKHTFDLSRGAAEERLKIAPRKAWYANIADIVTKGDHEVTFRLKNPQPSLLALLATGYGGIYPAHIPVARWRTEAVGTGPFMLKEYQRDRFLYEVKNPNYWVKNRPYLDAIRFEIIKSKVSHVAVFKTRQVDINAPLNTSRPFMETLKASVPDLVYSETPITVFPAVFFNPKVKPWDNVRLRQAVNLALDRGAYLRTVFQGGVVLGGVNLPLPAGAWGMTPEQVSKLPGYHDPEQAKEEARRIMASLGYGPQNPLRAKITVRGDTQFNVDSAVWATGELKQIYIESELHQMQTAEFFAALARRDFALGLHSSASAADDPDVTFYEHYGCGSPRNYSDYCMPEVEVLYAKQSAMTDQEARLKLVREIDQRLVGDVARAILGFLIDYNAMQPYVRNYVPHQTLYSFGRMQDVWLDK